jgi:uncharacterized glyoxalase superfamily protein PhnB
MWALDASEPCGVDRERSLPTGSMHVVIRISGAPLRVYDDPTSAVARTAGYCIVGGARSTFYVRDVSTPVHSVGAQLHPGASQLLFGVPGAARHRAEPLPRDRARVGEPRSDRLGGAALGQFPSRPGVSGDAQSTNLIAERTPVMRIHELYAYLRVKNAAAAIEFYKTAFGATEKFRLCEPSGRIGHAELDFDGKTLMVSEEFPEHGVKGPETIGGTSMALHLHVENADEMIAGAVKAGAKILRAPQDHFYGERSGTVRDPFGHEWLIGHEIESVTPTEMQKRYDALMKKG